MRKKLHYKLYTLSSILLGIFLGVIRTLTLCSGFTDKGYPVQESNGMILFSQICFITGAVLVVILFFLIRMHSGKDAKAVPGFRSYRPYGAVVASILGLIASAISFADSYRPLRIGGMIASFFLFLGAVSFPSFLKNASNRDPLNKTEKLISLIPLVSICVETIAFYRVVDKWPNTEYYLLDVFAAASALILVFMITSHIFRRERPGMLNWACIQWMLLGFPDLIGRSISCFSGHNEDHMLVTVFVFAAVMVCCIVTLFGLYRKSSSHSK